MATYTWYLNGSSSNITIGATDTVHFSNGTFGGAITVNSYNDGIHVRTSGGADNSNSAGPQNNKYATANTVSINGTGAVNTNAVAQANCSLHLNFNHTSTVSVSSWLFWVDDGAVTTNAPSNLTVQSCLYQANGWTSNGGSGSAINLGNSASGNTNHDRYVMVSCTPTAVAAITARYGTSLTYQ